MGQAIGGCWHIPLYIIGDIHGGDGGVPNGRWQKYCATQHLLFRAGTDLSQRWHCHVTDARFSCISQNTTRSPASILGVSPPLHKGSLLYPVGD